MWTNKGGNQRKNERMAGKTRETKMMEREWKTMGTDVIGIKHKKGSVQYKKVQQKKRQKEWRKKAI